ncbi:MAG: ferritin family protein [Candidatus Brocadiaceae bacterium]|nr:ferritin family protein [Candidatus Brocadiaceae bacterium]
MKYENFNDLEALDIAVNMEKEGFDFYTVLKENAKEKKVKELFSRLALEEKKHLELFQKAYNEINDSVSPVHGCEDYTVDAYLKHLVDTGVFSQKNEAKQLATEIKTDREALKIGIQAEKDAILYYSEAVKNTKNAAGKKIFDQLVAEERKHLEILSEYLKVLKEKPL